MIASSKSPSGGVSPSRREAPTNLRNGVSSVGAGSSAAALGLRGGAGDTLAKFMGMMRSADTRTSATAFGTANLAKLLDDIDHGVAEALKAVARLEAGLADLERHEARARAMAPKPTDRTASIEKLYGELSPDEKALLHIRLSQAQPFGPN